ncbi:MAG: PLD nuclease N-terminal domain-containing protein [Flavisolibacter sp.]
MRNVKHPNFILGIISLLLIFIGVGMRANGYESGDYVLIFSFLLAGIHWIWSIIDVFKDFRVNSSSENRLLWIILVIVLPVIGGTFYYAMSKTVRI